MPGTWCNDKPVFSWNLSFEQITSSADFTEGQAFADDELPDGWREAYYGTRTVGENDEYRLVTAVYEHVPLGLKTIVQPDAGNHSRVDDRQHTSHSVVAIYNVYDDLGMPSEYRIAFDDMREYLTSIIPEVKARGVENVNDGPYERRDNGEPRLGFHSSRVEDTRFDWDSIPEAAVKNLNTYKQYPIDYRPIVENIETMMSAESIYRTEPDSLPQPFEAKLHVGEHDDTGDKYFYITPSASKDLVDQVREEYGLKKFTPDDFEADSVLATLYLEFELDYHVNTTVADVEFTEAGESVANADTRSFPEIIRDLRK